MAYPIRVQILRNAGDIIAAGSGRVTWADYTRLTAGAMTDSATFAADCAAVLIVFAALRDRAARDVKARFDQVTTIVTEERPEVAAWVAEAVSVPILRRGIAMFAGRGLGLATPHAAVEALITNATAANAGLSLLVVFEMLGRRIDGEGSRLIAAHTTRLARAGITLDGGRSPAPPGGGASPSPVDRQCGACAGLGTITCGSCGGRGYQRYSRTRTRPDGRVEYYDENVPCSCASGRLRCSRCAGPGVSLDGEVASRRASIPAQEGT